MYNTCSKKTILDFVSKIINRNRSVEKRVWELVQGGMRVKRCYVRDYNGIGGCVYYERFHETRIIVGRPKDHYSREVYAVIMYDDEWHE